MKAYVLASASALVLATACRWSAWGQCQSGGGGGSSGTPAAMTASGGSSGGSGTAQLLTGPGSWAYDVMAAQQVQLAYARSQAVAAAQKAAKQADRKAKAQSVARQRRASELYRRDRLKEAALLAANK